MTPMRLRLLAPLLVLASWLLLAGPMDASAFQRLCCTNRPAGLDTR